MIISICSDPKILEIMRLVNIFINIIRIIVPILLIFSLMFKFMSVIKTGNENELAKVKKSSVINVVAAVLIFLIPNIISIIVKIGFKENDYDKCLEVNNITITEAYEDKMEKLVLKAEETLNINDYSNALSYLNNIKDENKRKSYEERLKVIKEKIDENNTIDKPNNSYEEYAKVDYSKFNWVGYEAKEGPVAKYYSNINSYLIYAPENISDLNGVSLPLIIWLGSASDLTYNRSVSKYITDSNAFPYLITNWSKFNLENIPAIIAAPQSGGSWEGSSSVERNTSGIKAIIDYSKDTYNIDMNNIVIMGHSIGARGSISMAYIMYEKYSKNYFSAIVPMSFLPDSYWVKHNVSNGKDYFTNMRIKGYTEREKSDNYFFEWIGKKEMCTYLDKNKVSHMEVPQAALTEDKNNNKISDLIEWLFDIQK